MLGQPWPWVLGKEKSLGADLPCIIRMVAQVKLCLWLEGNVVLSGLWWMIVGMVCFFGFTDKHQCLNLMQVTTGSQLREQSNGVTWENLRRLRTSHAAILWIGCRGLIVRSENLPGLCCSSPVSRWQGTAHLSGFCGKEWTDLPDVVKEQPAWSS